MARSADEVAALDRAYRSGGETGYWKEVCFAHDGLIPEFECFKACSNQWSSLINGSLRSLITTGREHPIYKEKGTENNAVVARSGSVSKSSHNFARACTAVVRE
jgi:hypothetical protein